MECQTNKPGFNCTFMTQKGCTFSQGACYEIVEQCEGCGKIVEYEAGRFCAVYPHPEVKWRKGPCNFATHVKREIAKDEAGKKINPLKAAKRAAKRR